MEHRSIARSFVGDAEINQIRLGGTYFSGCECGISSRRVWCCIVHLERAGDERRKLIENDLLAAQIGLFSVEQHSFGMRVIQNCSANYVRWEEV
jgi:hypothetical protein